MGYRNRYTVSNRYELVFMEGMEKVKQKRMGLRDTIKKIQRSWDRVNGRGSELLIISLTIIILWILLTHTV
jgi:hypothetical protein